MSEYLYKPKHLEKLSNDIHQKVEKENFFFLNYLGFSLKINLSLFVGGIISL